MRLKNKIFKDLVLKVFVVFSILLFVSTANVSFAKEKNSLNNFTVWSWSPYEIYKVDEFIEFAKDKKINKVFQYFDFENTKKSDINNFVKKLNANNISVYALLGEPSFAHSENHSKFELWVDHVIDYNKEYPDETIVGLSLDLEIHIEPEFNNPNKKEQLVYDYQNLTYLIKNRARENNLIVNHTIPFWYEYEKGHVDHGNYNLAEWAFLMGDEVSIMAYNHVELDSILENEMNYAKEYDKPVYVGFETQKPGMYELEESNTYYSRGVDRMYYDFERLEDKYLDIDVIPTIHNYNSFKELLTLQSDTSWIANNPLSIAEKTKNPIDVNFAKKLIDKLPSSPEKNRLKNRLKKIRYNKGRSKNIQYILKQNKKR